MVELKCVVKDDGCTRSAFYQDRVFLDDWTKLEPLYTISKAPNMEGNPGCPTKVALYIDDIEDIIFSCFDNDFCQGKALFAVTVIESNSIKIGCVKYGSDIGYQPPGDSLLMDLTSYGAIVKSVLDLNSHWKIDMQTKVLRVIVANSRDLLEYMSGCVELEDFFIIGADTAHVEY